MKCQKCARPAMVHLTEILTNKDVSGNTKRSVEIHLCLAHAVEAGLLAPGADTGGTAAGAPATKAAASSGAIVPVKPKTKSVAIATEPVHATDALACPACGMSWSQFKSSGVMGCTHDYEMFMGKLLPLLKRAQEGATEHTGKVPAGRRGSDADRRRVSVRLQRDLQRAVDAENYEFAAQLRDQLKTLEKA